MRPVALLAAVLATAATGIQAEPTIKATVQQMQSRPGGPYVSQGNGTWQSEPWWVHKAPLPKGRPPPLGPPPPIEPLLKERAELLQKQAALEPEMDQLRSRRLQLRSYAQEELTSRAGGFYNSAMDDLMANKAAIDQLRKAEERLNRLTFEYSAYGFRIDDITNLLKVHYGEDVARYVADKQLESPEAFSDP